MYGNTNYVSKHFRNSQIKKFDPCGQKMFLQFARTCFLIFFLEALDTILQMRDDLEIKAGNNINRELIPVLLHYGYTIKRSQQRLKELPC